MSLRPCGAPRDTCSPEGAFTGTVSSLLGFLMCRVLAAAVAELLELETASGRLLVLRRRVVPLFAIRALQCDDFAHLPILPYRSEPAFHHAFPASRWLFPYIRLQIPAASVVT